jgi:Holliday junction resolvasome RuvABC endonuclease subunit
VDRATLALDLGTTFGYALLRPDGKVEHGEEDLSLKKNEGEGARYLKFNRWLVDTNARHEIGRLYFESVVFSMPNAALASQVYGGLRAVMFMFVERNRITTEGFAPSTVKKRFAGHGNATKQDVKDQARRMGFMVDGFNEADAVAILHVGLDTCPLLTMNGASPKGGARRPKTQPEIAPGATPF